MANQYSRDPGYINPLQYNDPQNASYASYVNQSLPNMDPYKTQRTTGYGMGGPNIAPQLGNEISQRLAGQESPMIRSLQAQQDVDRSNMQREAAARGAARGLGPSSMIGLQWDKDIDRQLGAQLEQYRAQQQDQAIQYGNQYQSSQDQANYYQQALAETRRANDRAQEPSGRDIFSSLAPAIGAAAGSAFGPIGTAIGSGLGNLFGQNKKRTTQGGYRTTGGLDQYTLSNPGALTYDWNK